MGHLKEIGTTLRRPKANYVSVSGIEVQVVTPNAWLLLTGYCSTSSRFLMIKPH